MAFQEQDDGFKKFGGHKDWGIAAKSLLGVPWRIVLSLIDDDWILRNCIIWHKPNAMPCSVKDRLTNTYEFVFHFVKSKKYYYNLDAIRVPHKTVTVERMKRYIENKEHYDPSKHKTDPRGMHQSPAQVMENSAKKGLNPLGKNPGDVYDGKLAENPEHYASPRARRAREEFRNRDYHPLGKNPGDILTTVRDFTRPKADGVMRTGGMLPPPNVHKQNPYRVWNPKGKNPGDVIEGKYSRANEKGIDPRYTSSSGPMSWKAWKECHPNTTHPLGKNPGDFWIINTHGFKGAHFAVYPEELLRRPILSSSRIGDVVFDPFIGSGTSAVVAKKLDRHFLGCDINPEYVKIAEERLRGVWN